MGDFLVYEHWRPDKGTCFYVGKGKRKRAFSFRRNSRYDRIVAKLERANLKPEVRIVHSVGTDTEASLLEIARIAFWRSNGADLANYTDGGDGCFGRRLSPETRDKIRKKAIGRVQSKESIEKMVASRRGKKLSVETRAKMSVSATAAQKLRFERLQSTKEGRADVRLRMIRISRKGRGTPEYSEQKRQAALAGWARRRSIDLESTKETAR